MTVRLNLLGRSRQEMNVGGGRQNLLGSCVIRVPLYLTTAANLRTTGTVIEEDISRPPGAELTLTPAVFVGTVDRDPEAVSGGGIPVEGHPVLRAINADLRVPSAAAAVARTPDD